MGSLWVKRRFLGRGSFGRVFLAQSAALLAHSKSPALVPFVALKACLASRSWSLRLEKDMFEELGSCNEIVKCFGSGISIEDGVGYFELVLEYAAGGTLEQLLRFRGKKMSELEASYCTNMLLKGLSHVHEKGFVHCDMKPGNILVFPCKHPSGLVKYSLKLADFGSAKRAGETGFEFVDPCTGYKNRGTLLYSSPESVVFGEHEAPMDIWSLGCVVFHMLTGKRSMWPNNFNVDDIVLGDMIANYQDCGLKLLDDLSSNAKDFLRRCLARNTEERWTADELLKHPFITQISKVLPMSEASQTRKIMGYQKIDPFSSSLVGSFVSVN
ncbi:Serine carboxypeptidase 44 [Heracleum sosnowskyi]|uniref:Serine carboxypeptidase 44 n=1 Tax=Heracleum sosnowskyi TaxID=360622 RepID=A0AAD8M829_9APIA|nr:Serine carboxypeptidase 44 [Heracleum sosnowskyi]KAK1363109.1 Serine carboxypeptidase 44 [Heracleum sosnowskyi]KAK1363111.1 Serine carboxypeptidase 44 [Heracleum sosnowskyi]